MLASAAPVAARPEGTAKQPHGQIAGFDALRIFAALSVVALHLGWAVWTPEANPDGIPTHAFDFLQAYVGFGWIGVEIFFVLSGFVIAYSAFSSGALHFLQRRLARLVPGLFLCATLSLFAVWATQHLAHRTLIHRWLKSVSFHPLGPYIDPSQWTLSVEMSFYLLVCLLLLLKRVDRLALVLALLGLVSTCYNVLSAAQFHALAALTRRLPGWMDNMPLHQGPFLRHACYFTIGVYLWLCLFRAFTWQRVAVLCLTFVGGLCEIVFRARELTILVGGPMRPYVALTLWVLSLAAVIASTRFSSRVDQALGDRGLKWLRRFGLVTYPLYLMHQTLGKALILTLRPFLGDLPALHATLALLLGLSYVIALHIEPPLQRLMRAVRLSSIDEWRGLIWSPSSVTRHGRTEAELPADCHSRSSLELPAQPHLHPGATN